MEPAKLTDRFLAYLIDTLPFAVGYYVVIYWHAIKSNAAPAPSVVLTIGGCVLGLYVLYHFIGNLAGGTIGKKVMGIGVVGADGERLRSGRALIRALGLLISTPMFNLGCLWAFVNPESKAWHDMMAGSWVVEVSPKTASRSVLSAIVTLVVLIALTSLVLRFNLARPTDADLGAIDRAQRGLQLLGQIEEVYKATHGAYTDRLSDLAQTSGNPEQFKSSLMEIFDGQGFRVDAGRNGYRFTAHAKDRRRTLVTFSKK